MSVSILTSFYAFNKVFKNNKWMPHIATVLYERQGTTIRFSYDSDYEELIMLPLTYYKGYRIYLINEDGSKTRLEYEDIGRYKQLAFRCKSGSHVYECNYEGTMIQKTSFIISAITAAALAVYLMKHKVSNKGL